MKKSSVPGRSGLLPEVKFDCDVPVRDGRYRTLSVHLSAVSFILLERWILKSPPVDQITVMLGVTVGVGREYRVDSGQVVMQTLSRQTNNIDKVPW